MDAKFKYGNPIQVDHTAAAAIAAGDVVVVGDVPHVAHHAIDNADDGALACAGGVYEMAGDAAIAAGTKIYWDVSAGQVTETTLNNPHFGYTVDACTGAAAAVRCYHKPEAVTPASLTKTASDQSQ